jgi:NAD(P)-dependent dehydrogenase (short-subunit alcohol dehydrogenase family)
MNRFEGKVVIVTGVGFGIGADGTRDLLAAAQAEQIKHDLNWAERTK